MNAQRVARLVIVSGLMLLPAVAWAQTVVSGTIAGLVTDATGAVLPGVTVEAASPALIEKVRTSVTDDQGLYRIVDLRPGLYTVTFTLPGFSTFRREGLELTTAFTATVNAELKVGSLEETITVSGETPVVDVQNIMQQKVFARDVVDALPVGSNVNLYNTLLPGAVLATANRQDVGGNQGEQDQGFGIHGSRQADFIYLRDGMTFNTLMGSGNRTSSINPGSTQEVTVETGGILAESETGGVQMNIVPKDGGNTFTGSLQTSFGHPKLQNTNVTDELRARGVGAQPQIKTLYDVQVEVYPDHEDFAVRTMGMPGLGALGVAFGYVVAMEERPSYRPVVHHSLVSAGELFQQAPGHLVLRARSQPAGLHRGLLPGDQPARDVASVAEEQAEPHLRY